MVRFSRGLAPRVLDRKLAGCEPGSTANWQGAVEALRELLAHPNTGRGSATVILSNHFVRYLVLPWSKELVDEREELEFARSRFSQVFGEAASAWAVRLSPAQAGTSRLAAAIDQPLLDALVSALSASALRLKSVQPALMAQFNAWQRTIGNDAWLVSAERGRLLVAWLREGQWRAVRSRPLNGEPVSLSKVIEQERLLLAANGATGKVCLSVVDEVSVDTEGLRVEQLSPRARAGFAPRVDCGFSLAMIGAN